jgi:hypothetical protein
MLASTTSASGPQAYDIPVASALLKYDIFHSFTKKPDMRSLLTFLCLFLVPVVNVNAQDGYPVPPRTDTRLFYIQHSHNHNTFVYDCNMKDGAIDTDTPLEIYRIVYTEGGVRKPLTAIQRKMAYGMDVHNVDKNSFDLNLAASKKLKFHLILDAAGKPIVFININSRKIILDNMYVSLKEGTISPKAEFVVFTGRDFTTLQPVTEKVIPKD